MHRSSGYAMTSSASSKLLLRWRPTWQWCEPGTNAMCD
jgi:hypothetical protein